MAVIQWLIHDDGLINLEAMRNVSLCLSRLAIFTAPLAVPLARREDEEQGLGAVNSGRGNEDTVPSRENISNATFYDLRFNNS